MWRISRTRRRVSMRQPRAARVRALRPRRGAYDEHRARRVVLHALRRAARPAPCRSGRGRRWRPRPARPRAGSAALMISLAGDPLRSRWWTLGPQPVEAGGDVSTGALRGLAGRTTRPAAWRSVVGDVSSAKATAASGRTTATTETSVTLVGVGERLEVAGRCERLLRPVGGDDDVHVRPPSESSTRLAPRSPGRAAEEVLDQEERARPTASSPAHQMSESGSSTTT